MKRYYCKNCKTYLETKYTMVRCLCCYGLFSELPDYETPAQYEKRTWKKWNGALWAKCINEKCEYHVHSNWIISTTRSLADDELHKDCSFSIVICAQSPEPPPADWKPKEEV
ncbi:MAG: hypothetical protein LBG93_03060 [Treponema sp.]|jgi:hypothetical protein|nr:hypothetical protein [Treponema sp.]